MRTLPRFLSDTGQKKTPDKKDGRRMSFQRPKGTIEYSVSESLLPSCLCVCMYLSGSASPPDLCTLHPDVAVSGHVYLTNHVYSKVISTCVCMDAYRKSVASDVPRQFSACRKMEPGVNNMHRIWEKKQLWSFKCVCLCGLVCARVCV